MAERNVVVRYGQLHPTVKRAVNHLLQARGSRMEILIPDEPQNSPPILLGAVGALFGGLGSVSNAFWEAWPEHLLYNPFKGAAIGGLASAVLAGYAGYKAGSPRVRLLTKVVGRTIRRVGVVDFRRQIKHEDYAVSHPVRIVDRNGNILLISKGTLRSAYARARETFLKHALPGREPFR